MIIETQNNTARTSQAQRLVQISGQGFTIIHDHQELRRPLKFAVYLPKHAVLLFPVHMAAGLDEAKGIKGQLANVGNSLQRL